MRALVRLLAHWYRSLPRHFGISPCHIERFRNATNGGRRSFQHSARCPGVVTFTLYLTE